MNGYAAAALAAGPAPPYEADAYAIDWLADFSSRGGAALPVAWLKPDGVASGGAYDWSADAFGGGCDGSLGSLIVGFEGTSQSTPDVAAAAAIIRQYAAEGRYRATPFEPTGALLHAMLATSTVPMRGVFPRRNASFFAAQSAYAPYGERYLFGHGRIALARVLPLAADDDALVVLSNEHAALAAAGDVHRYCIRIEAPALASGAIAFSLALSYRDYPSAVGGVAPLVNDLDVRVYVDGAAVALYPNGLATRDGRSPTELVRSTTAAGTLRVEVVAAALGFDVQSYALALLVHTPNAVVYVDGAAVAGFALDVDERRAGTCSVCADDTYRRSGTCAATAECGNGVVDAGEACDYADAASPCCTLACEVWRNDSVACSHLLVVEGCVLPGTCASSGAAGECTPDMVVMGGTEYVVDPESGECVAVTPAPTPPPTAPAPTTAPPPGVCAHSIDAALRLEPLPGADDRFCCTTHADIAALYLAGGASGPLDVGYSRLARAVVAATANVRRGVQTSAVTLARLNEARALLASACTSGFRRSPTARRSAHELEFDLRTYSAGTCSGDSPALAPNASCVVEQTRADVDYCAARGTYSTTNDECDCPTEFAAPDCAERHCYGHGASSDGACTCVAGWTGTNCLACAAAPVASLRYVCVGLDRSRVPAALEPGAIEYSHVLEIVAATSVAARLDGTHYTTEARAAKAADALPGTGTLDCACGDAATALEYRDYPSPAELVDAVLDLEARRAALLAAARPAAATAAAPCSAASIGVPRASAVLVAMIGLAWAR